MCSWWSAGTMQHAKNRLENISQTKLDFFSPEKSDSTPDEDSDQDPLILLLKAAEHLYSEQ